MEFFTSEAKKAFIYLQKAFTKIFILDYFDPERHIYMETNALEYVMSGILSRITSNQLDQSSPNNVTHKNLEPIFSISKIGK